MREHQVLIAHRLQGVGGVRVVGVWNDVHGELVGGPLDGLLLDITGWRPEEIGDGVSLLTELGQSAPEAGRCTPLC